MKVFRLQLMVVEQGFLPLLHHHLQHLHCSLSKFCRFQRKHLLLSRHIDVASEVIQSAEGVHKSGVAFRLSHFFLLEIGRRCQQVLGLLKEAMLRHILPATGVQLHEPFLLCLFLFCFQLRQSGLACVLRRAHSRMLVDNKPSARRDGR